MTAKLATLAGILCAFAVETSAPPPASACGVKLAIKYSRPRRVAAKSARPSHVLLVGSPPRRLEHDLSSAGHDVEVEPSAGNAHRAKYDIVVVASNDQADDARSKFPDAAVVVRSGDITADVRSVENQADRRPVAVASGREVIAAGPVRDQPIAARPGETEHPVAVKAAASPVVAAKQPEQEVAAKPPEPAPAPTPAPTPPPPPTPAITATTSHPSEQPATKAVATTSAKLHAELYFSVNSSRVTDTHKLDQVVVVA